jgi:Up-Regulated in long-lived daf-2
MADNRTTSVAVANDMDGTATITLRHRFSDNPPEQRIWTALPIGQAGEPLLVHYQTGFLSGFDYWHVRVQVTDGRATGVWENDDWKECYLTEDDQGTVLRFSVSEAGGFKLNMISSSCTDELRKVS